MLSFDSLDPDGIPTEEYIRPGWRFVSKKKVVVGCVVFVIILVVVGLLCGLLGPGRGKTSCNRSITTQRIPRSIPPSTSTSNVAPSSTATTISPLPWENPLLPGDIRPSHYDLEILIDIDDQQRFQGNVSVTVRCFSTTDVLILHAKELVIVDGSARLEKLSGGGGGAPGFVKEPWTYPANQYLVAELDGPLVVGETYRFTIGFEAELVDGGLIGLYRSSYNTAAGQTRYLAATFFAPTNARKAFPCFDEPAMKASFNITIIHQPAYFALSNMPLVGTENATIPNADNGGDPSQTWVRSVFQPTPVMSTYIVCYVVCDFKRRTMITAGNVKFTLWAREEAMTSVAYALENGIKMLDFYESYFGPKFPLPKMDMIAIPDFSVGAMENWGLITYRESSLLYTPGQTAASSLQRISQTIGHELAHQWFGNLVSFDWWNDLWLKEGFASYIEYIGANFTEPDWAMLDQFVALDFYSALTADALTTSRPIIVDVDTADDINQQYDSIAYDKGSSIIRMIQSFLGEQTFRRGLEIYLTKYKYDNAKNTDLWNCFTEAATENHVTDIDVKMIMDTWTLQMGYPTVTVIREYSSGSPSFTANQKRFLINPDSNITSHYGDLGYTWHIPLRYITKVDSVDVESTLSWLRPNTTMTIALNGVADGDWLLMNVNSYGYFRVNYDANNWALLIAQLNTDHQAIPVSNRAALLSDAFNLAQAGDLSYITALNLSLYLRRELDYVPWEVAYRAVNYINRMLSRTPIYGSFQKHIEWLVEPFYRDVGWDDENSDHLEQLGRVVAIHQACSYGNRNCTTTATSLFRRWMKDPVNISIPANQKSTVYCTAIAQGGQEEWFFAFRQYESTIVASERAMLLAALSCSGKPWILNYFLHLSLDRIKSQDTVSVVTSVANNAVGYDLAWDFFKSNWDSFRKTYGSSLFQFSGLIEGVTAHFTTQLQLEELLQFIQDHPDQGTGERALSKAVEQTRANIRWMASSKEDIAAWLKTRND